MSTNAKPLLNLHCTTCLEVRGVQDGREEEAFNRIHQTGVKAELRSGGWFSKNVAGLNTVVVTLSPDRLQTSTIIAKAKDEPATHSLALSAQMEDKVDKSSETFTGKEVYSNVLLELHSGDGKDHVENVLSRLKKRGGIVDEWKRRGEVHLIDTGSKKVRVSNLTKLRSNLANNLFQFDRMMIYSEAAESQDG